MPPGLDFTSKNLALSLDQEGIMNLRDHFQAFFLSCLALSFLVSHRPALAQATTVEMVFDGLKKLETDLKFRKASVRCRQFVQHSLWARVFPRLRKKEEVKADAEWREEIEFSANVLRRSKENSLHLMSLVFFRLSQNKARYGEMTSVDPAIRDIVFPIIEEQITRLIAEATDTDTIYMINNFFIDLETQLQRAMRELLREKGIRGLVAPLDLIRQIESKNPWSQTSQLYSFVEQLHGRILSTATNIQMVDSLVESGMKDLWELCPGCK
jgi:hypothetical protein